MNQMCFTVPCRRTSAGCPVCDPAPTFSPFVAPAVPSVPGFSLPLYHPGCICPPTSEGTCKSKTCPRRDHSSAIAPKPSASPEQVKALADAMGQILEDIGPSGRNTPCLAAASQARVAYEPFVDPEDDDRPYIMPLDLAERIVKECK